MSWSNDPNWQGGYNGNRNNHRDADRIFQHEQGRQERQRQETERRVQQQERDQQSRRESSRKQGSGWLW